MYFTFSPEMLRTKDAMRGEMDRRAIYGSGMFVGQLREDYEIEEMVRPVGRPKKKMEKRTVPILTPQIERPQKVVSLRPRKYWLGDKDLNLDSRSQSPLSYH